MIALYIFLAVLALLIPFLIVGGKNDKMSRFSQRQNLSMDELYVKYFLTSKLPKEVVVSAWEDLAGLLELPGGLLRPDDRFDNELRPEKGNEWDDPCGLLPNLIERRCSAAGIPLPDIGKVLTVRDYIYAVSQMKPALRVTSRQAK